MFGATGSFALVAGNQWLINGVAEISNREVSRYQGIRNGLGSRKHGLPIGFARERLPPAGADVFALEPRLIREEVALGELQFHAGANTLGVNKLGANTLTLTGVNTYKGRNPTGDLYFASGIHAETANCARGLRARPEIS